MNFTLVPSPVDHLIPLLTHSRTGFLDSPEFARLRGTGEDLPTVVAAAYSEFVSRAAREGLTEQELIVLIEPLSEAAAWGDPAVNHILREEIFEILEEEGALRLPAQFGGPQLIRLLDSWADGRGGGNS